MLLVVAGPVHRAELRVLHARGRRARARVRDLGALQRKLRQREPSLVLVKLERVPIRIDDTLKIDKCIYTFFCVDFGSNLSCCDVSKAVNA